MNIQLDHYSHNGIKIYNVSLEHETEKYLKVLNSILSYESWFLDNQATEVVISSLKAIYKKNTIEYGRVIGQLFEMEGSIG